MQNQNKPDYVNLNSRINQKTDYIKMEEKCTKHLDLDQYGS